MKKVLLTIIAVCALSATAGADAPRHRHQHTDAETVATADTSSAIVAYSDTTSFDSASYVEVAVDDDTTTGVSVSPSDYSDPFSFFNALWLAGIGGVVIALLITFALLAVLLLPVVLLILLIRYLIKRHNDRVELERLRINAYGSGAADYAAQSSTATNFEQVGDSKNAQQASAAADSRNYENKSGFKFPSFNMNTSDSFNVQMWSKGLKNMTLGVGLALMFLCLGAHPLVGVGLLVMCYGAGQALIAYTTANRMRRKEDAAGSSAGVGTNNADAGNGANANTSTNNNGAGSNSTDVASAADNGTNSMHVDKPAGEDKQTDNQ